MDFKFLNSLGYNSYRTRKRTCFQNFSRAKVNTMFPGAGLLWRKSHAAKAAKHYKVSNVDEGGILNSIQPFGKQSSRKHSRISSGTNFPTLRELKVSLKTAGGGGRDIDIVARLAHLGGAFLKNFSSKWPAIPAPSFFLMDATVPRLKGCASLKCGGEVL